MDRIDRSRASSRQAFLIRALLVAVPALLMSRQVGAQVGPPTVQDQDTINAIHDSTLYGGVPTIALMARLRWTNYRIWEYNDEQRLHNGAGGYGPIAHVFASDSLNRFTLDTFIVAGPMGRLVGILFIRPDGFKDMAGRIANKMVEVDPALLTGAITPNQVANAASLLGLPPRPPLTYQKQSLSWAYNCIYFRYSPSLTLRWRAYVTPARLSEHPCPADHIVVPHIPIKAVRFPGFTAADDYPPVGRFHEGKSVRSKVVPLFGLKCASAWCTVMSTVTATDTVPRGFPSSVAGSRNWTIPGWQDVQHLAKVTPVSVTPYWSFKAAIIADSLLGERTLTDFEFAGSNDQWVRVATIFLPTHPPAGSRYETAWRLKAGRSRMYLRKEPNGWNGILVVGTDTVPLKVFRKDHKPHRVPGTARWRWDEHDEMVWVRCDEGCCRVAPN